jgi:ATP-binding cassette subfamily F protein uup
MPLLRIDHLSLAYGHHALLDGVDFTLEAGERACLVGRNGSGKSTLLRVIARLAAADAGEVRLEKGARVAYLPQEPALDADETVFECVAAGLAGTAELILGYHQAVAALTEQPDDPQRLNELQHWQERLEAQGAWDARQRVEETLSRLQLPADARLSTLSGGWRRRVALGRALVGEPDLLLLDEPTNHLDIDTIVWLEELLRQFRGALLFVTHDRLFLEHVATRILELDRGHLRSFPGSYPRYLEQREAARENEATQDALFEKRLAEEEVWIRQGIQARRTRNMGRVRALLALRQEHAQHRELAGNVKLALDSGTQSGKLVLEAEHIDYAYADGKPIVNDFLLRVLRGDRIGLIGPNGAGKTTLLRLLLKEIAPDRGEVRHGTRLQIAYFDQLRAQLDPQARVVDCVGEGKDTVTVGGRQRHVMSYLADFLFPPERARSPVKSLSGGERNRLLLARLFAQPANLLVLDEPTNDLDIETLELLEELIANYDGTLFLVSHDRAFVDNVVTSCLVFEGDGRIGEYVGGYSDWLRQRAPAPTKTAVPQRNARAPRKPKETKKLSYTEQRELDGLPARIEQLEQERHAVAERLADPVLYRAEPETAQALARRAQEMETETAAAYARWEALEQRTR